MSRNFFDHLFDSDYRQREDINSLHDQIDTLSTVPDHTEIIREMASRLDQLELLNKALLELVTQKGLVSQEEVGVMMKQIDLLDGVEDGKLSSHVHRNAPTCPHCGRYVNPRRTQCVYCRAPLNAQVRAAPVPKPQKQVSCSRCGEVVPENQTLFAASGLVCEPCYHEIEAP